VGGHSSHKKVGTVFFFVAETAGLGVIKDLIEKASTSLH